MPRMERAELELHKEHWLHVERLLLRLQNCWYNSPHALLQQQSRDVRDAVRGKAFHFLEAKHTLHSQADSGPHSALRARD